MWCGFLCGRLVLQVAGDTPRRCAARRACGETSGAKKDVPGEKTPNVLFFPAGCPRNSESRTSAANVAAKPGTERVRRRSVVPAAAASWHWRGCCDAATVPVGGVVVDDYGSGGLPPPAVGDCKCRPTAVEPDPSRVARYPGSDYPASGDDALCRE